MSDSEEIDLEVYLENMGAGLEEDVSEDTPSKKASPPAIKDFGAGSDTGSDLESFMDNMELDVYTGEDLSKPWMKYHHFHLITQVSEVKELIQACLDHGNCALDLETEGFDNRIEYNERGDPYTVHKIVGYCLGLKGQGYYIPVRHRYNPTFEPNPNVDDIVGTEAQIKMLCQASQPDVRPASAAIDPLGSKDHNGSKVIIKFWHAKFDQEFLYPITGIDWWHPDSFEDGMLASYVIYTDGIHGLKENASTRLQVSPPDDPETAYPYEMIKFSDLFPKGTPRKKQGFYNLQPRLQEDSKAGWNCVLYGCSDGICTDLLCDKLVPEATKKKYAGFYRIEKQVVQAVRIMERIRVKIDKSKIVGLLEEAERELNNYEKRIVKVAADSGFPNFNPASSAQLGQFLFEDPKGLDLKPKPAKTDQDQYKTDEKTLAFYIDRPGAPDVLSWVVKHRQINKVKGTYLENLAKNTDEHDQLRLNFKQTGASTGRFTAPKGDADHGFSGVPIQGIPAKNDPTKPQVAHSLRRMFVAREGYTMVKVDYASQELRIAASVSGEPKWVNEYVKEIETGTPADLHFLTAQAFFPGLKKGDPDFKLKRGAGKCVHLDTLLDTDMGYRPIKDVAPFPATSDSFFNFPESDLYHYESLVDSNPVVATYNGGVKPLVHVVTRKGIVTCTEEHRFVNADGELVRAGDLEKGMNLRPVELPTMPRVGGSNIKQLKLWKGTPHAAYKTGAKEAYFAGAFLGDGSVSASGSRITHGDVHKLDTFDEPYDVWQSTLKQACEDIGLAPTCEDKSLYLGSRVVVKYLEGLGLVIHRPDTEDGRMKNLRVPEWVIEGGQEKFLPFLGGLIDTDGSGGHQQGSIEFTTKDFVFAGQVATLAQACGLQLSVEATYNRTYKRHYACLRFTVASSWELRKHLNYKGKADRLREPSARSMLPNTNDVLAILPAGDGQCLDITMGTEEHLYRANGMLTHNTANFALVYGGGVGAVQRATGCDQSEGGRLLKAFHESVPLFSKWVDRQHKIVKKQKGVRTGFKRFISVPDAEITARQVMERHLEVQERRKAKDSRYEIKKMSERDGFKEAKRIQAACERKSTNYPIQGSGADILKISLIFLSKEFHLRGWLKNGGDDSVRLVMTVHDEIVFEIRHDRVAEAIPVLKKIMEYPSTLAGWTVPLIAEPELGDSWNAHLDWISMRKGDKDHPVPDYLQDKEINDDPEVLVLSNMKGRTPPDATPVPQDEALQPVQETQEEPQEEQIDISDEEVNLPKSAVEILPVPEKATTSHKRFALFRLDATYFNRSIVRMVSRAIKYSRIETYEVGEEMVPLELQDDDGNTLIDHKDGVLIFPSELARKFREYGLGSEPYNYYDV